MSSSQPFDAHIGNVERGGSGEPSPKRQKKLACVRCRRRKQRCDDTQRPCSNCIRSSAECQPSAPSLYYQRTQHGQAAFQGDEGTYAQISALEQRVRDLEHQLPPANGPEITACSPEAVTNSWSSLTARKDSQSTGMLNRSTPAIGLLTTFAHSPPDAGPKDSGSKRQDYLTSTELDKTTQQTLVDTYRTKIHTRYPFLPLDHILHSWEARHEAWSGFFINMILSLGLLHQRHPQQLSSHDHRSFYRVAVTQHLSHVFQQRDRIMHIQAYLMLSMHALHSPSTERICSLASATVRYCIMAQLHLKETEPPARNAEDKLNIQMRRRVFWSAYALDRAAGTMFDVPFSVADYVITVPMYANIGDMELLDECQQAFPEDPPGRPDYTTISAALHVVYCRQIQSEILNITLHRDFKAQFDGSSNWRLHILEKLEHWKSLSHRISDACSNTYTSTAWLHMIYNFSLTMLYRPTQQNANGPAPEWTVKACVQACLIFRKFQREGAIFEAWMGLIQQFKCGIALLYSFFVTSPAMRSETFSSPEISEALRACSVILSLLAERWPESECLRDTFDILAREIPLVEDVSKPPSRMRQASSDALLAEMDTLSRMVVHRDTLRMIEEMATQPFPRPRSHSADGDNLTQPTYDTANALVTTRSGPPVSDTSSLNTGEFFKPMTPHFFRMDEALELHDDAHGTLEFPGIFDLDLEF